MKKILLLLILLLSASVYALEVREGTEISLEDDLNESVLVFADSINVDAMINGDVTIFGGSISLNEVVLNDILLLGGDVNVNGPVGDDAHAFGGSININGPIYGDLTAAGGSINVNDVIGGDLRVAGGSININGVEGDVIGAGGSFNVNGPIGGDLVLGGGTVKINGIIEGDVLIDADEIRLGKDAIIRGDFNYTAKKATFNENQIEGLILKNEYTRNQNYFNKTLVKVFFGFAMILIGVALVLIMPNVSNKLVNKIDKNFWQTMLIGLLTLIVTPIVGVLLVITIIGIPFALLLILLYIIAIFLSIFVTSLYVGKLLLKKQHIALAMVLGLIIYLIVTSIPYLGGFIGFVAIVLGLGSIASMLFIRKKNKEVKKK